MVLESMRLARPLPDSVARRYPHGYAVVDVETTGLHPRSHRVVQIAVAHLSAHGTPERTWSTLLDPGCDPGPVEIHGLTLDRLAGSPQYPAVAAELAELLDGRVLVAHNAGFDWRFLAAEARRTAHPLPVRKRLCTLALTRHLDLPVDDLSLASVAAYWGVAQTRAHDAVDDTRVLAEILLHSLIAAERVALPLPLVACDPADAERDYPARHVRPPCRWVYPGRWAPDTRLVQGMLVAITGQTAAPREVLTARSIDAGLDVINSVSGRTSLLVANDAASPTGKARNAAKHSVPVVDEATFVELLGDVAAGVGKAEPEPAAPSSTEPPVTGTGAGAGTRTARMAPAPGPLTGRCFLVLGGPHAQAAEMRARIGNLGGIAAVNLTARVTDVVSLPGAELEPRWARIVALGLPVCDAATFAPIAHRAGASSTAVAPEPAAAPAPVVVLPRGGVVDLPQDCRRSSISVSWPNRAAATPVDVDVVAFLTDDDEQVRADSDFVFYNAPASADGSVELTLDIPNEALVHLRLDDIPDDVTRVILAATLPDGHTFGELGPVEIVVRTEAGATHIRATLDAATTECSLLLASVYRRLGQWRFRAIGQGYEYGLAELATQHGVSIED